MAKANLYVRAFQIGGPDRVTVLGMKSTGTVEFEQTPAADGQPARAGTGEHEVVGHGVTTGLGVREFIDNLERHVAALAGAKAGMIDDTLVVTLGWKRIVEVCFLKSRIWICHWIIPPVEPLGLDKAERLVDSGTLETYG
jgi:hypothetical protein